MTSWTTPRARSWDCTTCARVITRRAQAASKSTAPPSPRTSKWIPKDPSDTYKYSQLPSVPQNYFRAEGILKNCNTIEDYRNLDRGAILERAGRMVNTASQVSCATLLIACVDLGSYPRWLHLRMPVAPRLIYLHFLRGLKEIQVHLSLRLSRHPLRSAVETSLRDKATHPQRDHALGR